MVCKGYLCDLKKEGQGRQFGNVGVDKPLFIQRNCAHSKCETKARGGRFTRFYESRAL